MATTTVVGGTVMTAVVVGGTVATVVAGASVVGVVAWVVAGASVVAGAVVGVVVMLVSELPAGRKRFTLSPFLASAADRVLLDDGVALAVEVVLDARCGLQADLDDLGHRVVDVEADDRRHRDRRPLRRRRPRGG